MDQSPQGLCLANHRENEMKESNFKVYGDEGEIPLKIFKFPGGEIQVKISPDYEDDSEELTIIAHLHSSDDVMALLLLTDSLHRNFGPNLQIDLEMPYIPYARQDRVCDDGEALAVKVFCDLINSQNYNSVTVMDPHSDVAPALLNRCYVINQGDLLDSLDLDIDNTVLVSPDAGATKKILAVAKARGFKEIVRADKIRDTTTGAITGTVVYSEHIGDKDFLIVDDICDGGRTFLELAKVLRPLTNGKIILFVSHGIFSKGLLVFRGIIDEIYTANPFDDYQIFENLMDGFIDIEADPKETSDV